MGDQAHDINMHASDDLGDHLVLCTDKYLIACIHYYLCNFSYSVTSTNLENLALYLFLFDFIHMTKLQQKKNNTEWIHIFNIAS